MSDDLVSELRADHGNDIFNELADKAADAIARLTRERDEAMELHEHATDCFVEMKQRAETAEAALSTARAELAECRNKALEEAATLVSGTAQALSPHILLAPDETKSALVEATVVALNSICDGIRTLKSEAPHA